jgi:hypothetical protein
MEGIELKKEIESGNVTHYCKPSTLENGSPTSSSFQLRVERNEEYLSVFLLEYFNQENEIDNVRNAKKEMHRRKLKTKDNGSFAVFDIEHSKNYIFDKIKKQISCKELDLPHCGIFHDSDDLVISELLTQCVKSNYLSKLV